MQSVADMEKRECPEILSVKLMLQQKERYGNILK